MSFLPCLFAFSDSIPTCTHFHLNYFLHMCSYSSSKNSVASLIGLICSHFNRSIGLVLSQFNHLFIHWTCLLQWIGRWYCLLVLVVRLLWLWALGSVLADAVEQQNPNKNSSNKYYYCSTCNCNPHSSSNSEGLLTNCRRRKVCCNIDTWLQ